MATWFSVQGLAVSGLTILSPHETILSSNKYSLVWLKWVTILWLVTHHPNVGGCSSVTQMNAYMMKELSNQSSLWSNLRPQAPGQKIFWSSDLLIFWSSDLLIFWSSDLMILWSCDQSFIFQSWPWLPWPFRFRWSSSQEKKNFKYPCPGGVRVKWGTFNPPQKPNNYLQNIYCVT